MHLKLVSLQRECLDENFRRHYTSFPHMNSIRMTMTVSSHLWEYHAAHGGPTALEFGQAALAASSTTLVG